MVLIFGLKSKRLLRTSWNNQKHFLRIYYKATLILIIKLKNKIIQIVVIVGVGFIIFFSNNNKIDADSNNPQKVLYTLRNGSIERPLRSFNLTDKVSNHNLNSNSHITVECVIKSDSSRKLRPKKQQTQTLQGLLDEKAKETKKDLKKNQEENKQSDKLQEVSQKQRENKKSEDEKKKVSKITTIKKIMASYDNLLTRCQYKLTKRAKRSKNIVKRFCYNSGSKIIRKLKFSHYAKFRLYGTLYGTKKGTLTLTTAPKRKIQTLQGLLDQKDKEQSQKSSSPEYMLNESENQLLKSFAMKTKEKLAQDKTALEKKCHTEEMNLSKLKVKMILSAVENWKSNHEIEGETITEYFERQIKIIKENDGESRLKDFNLKRELKNFEEKFNIHTLGDISNNGSRKKQIKKTQPEFQIIGILSDDDKLIGFGIKEKLE
jgi:hypothetical protein